ncbi:MAG TPA: YraN family protein [Burkholderiales bacterium]|jgi:putative endonuclease|nr:YraN family protein [Burkholderiales bacterium]
MAFLFSRNKLDGPAAEDLAARYLQQHGLRLIDRNYRCRGGEIDLIMQTEDTLVFIEVRLRRSQRFGGAAASVDATKQARVIHAARNYLGERDIPCRFDVLLMDDIDPARIEWIRDAFGE